MNYKKSFPEDLMLLLSISLVTIMLIFNFGCGKNNLLQGFTKPEEHENKLELAQQYLDNGEYDKALSMANSYLSNHANDSDALAIKGQSYLGKAGAGISDILSRIGGNKETTSNFNALSILKSSKLDDLYTAASILKQLHSTDQDVQLSEGIACMLAAVHKVTWTFDPIDGKLGDGSSAEPLPGADVSGMWGTIKTDVLSYSVAGAAAIAAATGHDELKQEATSINAELQQVPVGAITYSAFLLLLGY